VADNTPEVAKPVERIHHHRSLIRQTKTSFSVDPQNHDDLVLHAELLLTGDDANQHALLARAFQEAASVDKADDAAGEHSVELPVKMTFSNEGLKIEFALEVPPPPAPVKQAAPAEQATAPATPPPPAVVTPDDLDEPAPTDKTYNPKKFQ
jgi:hypothetical protein